MEVVMKVKDIMTKDVACVRSDDTVERAAQLMKQYNCGALPVCTQDKLIGIVTDRDIAVRSVATGHDLTSRRIGDIMTDTVVFASPDLDVRDAAKLMSERQIRRLPVVENGSLVGIVALGDISLEPSYQDSAQEALNNISKPGGSFY